MLAAYLRSLRAARLSVGYRGVTASAMVDLSRFATDRGWETHHFSTEDLEEYLCYVADRLGENGKSISETMASDHHKHSQ